MNPVTETLEPPSRNEERGHIEAKGGGREFQSPTELDLYLALLANLHVHKTRKKDPESPYQSVSAVSTECFVQTAFRKRFGVRKSSMNGQIVF